MSATTQQPLPLAAAQQLAQRVLAALIPVCSRVCIAGSVRRRRATVNDLEIVCIPNCVPTLFGSDEPDTEAVRRALMQFGDIVKGGERYIQIAMLDGFKIDVFLIHAPSNWFVQLVIRTGPWTLGRALMQGLLRNGFRCEDGRVLDSLRGREHPIASEADFFAAAGMQYLPPEQRDGAGA